ARVATERRGNLARRMALAISTYAAVTTPRGGASGTGTLLARSICSASSSSPDVSVDGVAFMKRAEVAQYWEANAETWTRHARAGYDIYRDGLNTPAFLDMLPPVHGLSGLDIGCGEGANTRELVRLGARMHAIDVAPTFIRHARHMERAAPRGLPISWPTRRICRSPP